MPFVIANKIMDGLCDAFGVKPEYCQRAILDLQAGNIPRIYFQMVGDDHLIEIVSPLSSESKVDVKILDGAQTTGREQDG